MTSMETRIEAGDLRHIRQSLEDGLNRREIVGLVQWGQRDQIV
jgi:hypothetical protein